MGWIHGDLLPLFPVGLGGTLSAYPNLKFGIELGFRYAFSDNLDGYTSQYSSANDVYYFFNFTVTYRLKITERHYAILQIKSWISFNEKIIRYFMFVPPGADPVRSA